MLRFSLVPWFFILYACQNKPSLTISQQLKIGIIPLECSNEIDIERLGKEISNFYNCNFTILNKQKLPSFAFNPSRKRYRADSILNFLESIKPDSLDILMAITSKDIAATVGKHKDWGVFGLANCPGNVCVISDFRVHKNKTKERLITRLKNVALHEIGHNFSLPHCGDSTCIMKDAKGKLSSIEGVNRKFCKRCYSRLYH